MTETNTSRTATRSEQEPEQESASEAPETDSTPEAPDEQPGPPELAESANPFTPVEETPAAASAPPIPAVFADPVREPGLPESSPDGRWLAYLYPAEDGGMELWLSPTDGGEAARIDLPFQPVEDIDPDTGRHVRGPQWSPDGTTLALTGTHPDGDRTAIWLVSLGVAPSDATVVTTSAAPPVSDGEPESEADAAQVTQEQDGATAASVAEDAPADVPVENEVSDAVAEPAPAGETDEGVGTPTAADTVAAGASPAREAPGVDGTRLLADLRVATRSPRWSPDGTLMVVVMTQDGVDQIGLAQPDLTDLPPMIEPITSGVLAHREPVWSRDGRFIAFTRQHGSDWRFADICTFEPRTGELKDLTGDKDPTIRHSLDWVPGRNLVAFVTRDGDWLAVAVVNADNKAGWVVTREAGDKWGQRFAAEEARLIYIRSEGFSTVLVERGLHGSNSIAIDPGEGVVAMPVWTGPKSVAYGFSAPQKPLGWFTQETSADTERTVVSLPEMVTAASVSLRHPAPFEFDVGPEEQFSGLLYQSEGLSGPVPGAVYVPDGALTARLAAFQREEQALASSGFAVLAPVLHGASGFGTAVEDDLAEYGDAELEAADLAAAGEALAAREGVDASKLVLIGDGFGGTLALVAAGARPGVFGTVIAIDPITDWTIEIDGADRPWRQWVIRQYGLPLSNADRYALRTPETFAGVIDGEIILVSTPRASEARRSQGDAFRGWLDDTGIAHTHIELDAGTAAGAMYELGQMLAERLRTPAEPSR
jgi:dipeptidyl aminopeptidase/acylaminoacyl peptidase